QIDGQTGDRDRYSVQATAATPVQVIRQGKYQPQRARDAASARRGRLAYLRSKAPRAGDQSRPAQLGFQLRRGLWQWFTRSLRNPAGELHRRRLDVVYPPRLGRAGVVLDRPHHPDLANQQAEGFSELPSRKLGTSGGR